MILLEPENYHLALEPLQTVEINHLFARAVAEQKVDGRIYADDPLNPSVFYVKHAYGMSLLFGETGNETFNRQLKNYLLNADGGRKQNEWLQAYPQSWKEKLKEVLNGNLWNNPNSDPKPNPETSGLIAKFTRVNFKFNPENFLPVNPDKVDGFRIKKTDADLFGKISGTVVPRYFWRNGEEFVKYGAGFSLMAKNEPISTAFSAFVHDQKLELGIETQPQFQGKGLARMACSALIDYCLENNYEPVWACRLENTGSFKLAQKLGFEPIRMIPYYQLPTNI